MDASMKNYLREKIIDKTWVIYKNMNECKKSVENSSPLRP